MRSEDQNMKIALLVSGIIHHKKESLAITTLALAKKLAKENDVFIMARKKNNTPKYEEIDGVAVYRTKPFGNSSIYNKLLSFPWELRKFKEIDVLHSFSSSPLLVLRSLLANWLFFRKATVIHTLKSYPIRNEVNKKRSLLNYFSEKCYYLLNFVDYVTVPTKVHAYFLIKKGVKKKKIKIVRSPVELERFKVKDKVKLKERYGYSGKKVVFNYGSMWEIKGTGYFVESIPAIVKINPNVKFVLAPRNVQEAKEKYWNRIKALGMDKYVDFIEKDIIVEDYVNLADVVVIPYPHLEGTEGNPSCLIEAIACGTLIVTTRLPELEEVFGDCAILVEPRNVESLTKGIIKALEGDNLDRVKKGLEISRQFDLDLVTKQFRGLYCK